MHRPLLKYIYLFITSLLLLGFGVLCFFVSADWWGLAIVIIISGCILFVGMTAYIIIKRIKIAKKRIVFNVFGYAVASGLSVGGIVYAIYSQYYKTHSGFMPGLDALGDWLISIFFIIVGAILFIGLTGSNIAHNTSRKKNELTKDE